MFVQLRNFTLVTLFAVVPIFGSQGTGSITARAVHPDSVLLASNRDGPGPDAALLLKRADLFVSRQ